MTQKGQTGDEGVGGIIIVEIEIGIEEKGKKKGGRRDNGRRGKYHTVPDWKKKPPLPN